MTNDNDEKKDLTVPLGDGFEGGLDESSGGSIIRGWKAKFDDRWVAGEDEIPPDRELLVYKMFKIRQKWLPTQNKPAATLTFPIDANFAETIDELNARAPKTEWRNKFGQMAGPWEEGYCVYMIDEATMERFSFVTTTIGGGMAVRELRESGQIARMMQGTNVFPRVTLGSTPMKTQYGGRERPYFVVRGYKPIGPAESAPLPPAPPQPQLSHGGEEKCCDHDHDDLGDNVVEMIDVEAAPSPASKAARKALAGAKAKVVAQK